MYGQNLKIILSVRMEYRVLRVRCDYLIINIWLYLAVSAELFVRVVVHRGAGISQFRTHQ